MSLDDKINNQVWVERYAPKKVQDCILPDRIKTILQEMVDTKKVKNVSLIGSAGAGKTSSAKAMLHELGVDYLMINASENGNIDTIRNKVREYGTKKAFGSDYDYKVILLDEADGLTPTAANSLRGIIEEFQNTCKFILTANYTNKVPEALKSRCPVLEFSFTKEEKAGMMKLFFGRIEEILKENNVTYDRSDLAVFCNKNFPDFRRSLNIIYRSIINGTLELKNIGAANDDKIDELVGYLKNSEFTKMRKWVAESGDTEPSLVRRALYNRMYDFIEPSDIPTLVILLNEYDYKEGFVTDVEINTVALFTQIMKEVEFK